MMKKKKLLIGSLLALLIIICSGVYVAQASRVTIEKPFEPFIINEGDIPNPISRYRTDPMEILCRLEEGKTYHIFLVGDWITNETSKATDYDIEVFDSQNKLISGHTESAGLPEQVTNDNNHQYFVPPKTDTYMFVIHNDPEDSNGEDAAVFMIIEHLEMNKKYEVYLEGRPSPSTAYPDDYVWAYEFATPNEDFSLHVKVPDPEPEKGIPGLDMYEARLFPMANPSAQVGYYISGVGVPYGELLQGEVQGQYGLYNLSIPGKSFPELRASGEYAGEDLDVVFGKPVHNETELVLDTREVYYYIVMLAEYYQGTIEFYIKTDYRQVNITLVEAPEIGVTDQETKIVLDIDGPADIEAAWLNYTIDGWNTEQRIYLNEIDGQYECWLPRFDLLDEVQYRVYARDEIGNSGMTGSSILILDPIHLHIETEKLKVNGGESMKISGEVLEFCDITLSIMFDDSETEVRITTDAEGQWTYNYKPPKEGRYYIKTYFNGDGTHPAAESRELTFTMEKQRPLISYVMNPIPAKMTRDLEVSGQLTPPIAGVTVSMIYNSESDSLQMETVTENDGSFSFIVVPDEIGMWQILTQIPETAYVRAAQSELKDFEVIELTILEKATEFLLGFTIMPLMLVPIGLTVGGLTYGELKSGFIRSQIAAIRGKDKKIEEVEPESSEKTHSESDGATTYRRRSER